MALLHVDFFSEVLGQSMQMDVILPQQTKKQMGMSGVREAGKYPTLYLLHGLSDDHTIWQRRTSIERYVSEMGLAVVMPNAHLSMYTDMYQGAKYWTYISEELPRICREFFPNMSSRREDTYAAGLSMGGYGAMKLGLAASETFGGVASLSGALNMGYQLEHLNHVTVTHQALMYQIFGPVRQFAGSENDLFFLAEKLVQEQKLQPRIYMCCGTEDFIYEDTVAFHRHLTCLGISHEYDEGPGIHNWEYWDAQIQKVLQWMKGRFSIQ